MKRLAGVLAGLAVLAAGAVEARPLRVMALDQCADQYVLALRPDAELGLSPRADDPDSWMREAAAGRQRIRPTLEAAIAFEPDVVVRYWGGEPRLLARLKAKGTQIITISDANTFNEIKENISTVSQGLGVPGRGEALAARMHATLQRAAPEPATPQRSALYLTAGGFTAGKGTLMDAILAAAGLRNAAAKPFLAPVSVERIALFPPARFVLGFFDQPRSDWRGPGRHPVVQRAAKGRIAARLPSAALTCPAWFAADAAAMLKDGT